MRFHFLFHDSFYFILLLLLQVFLLAHKVIVCAWKLFWESTGWVCLDSFEDLLILDLSPNEFKSKHCISGQIIDFFLFFVIHWGSGKVLDCQGGYEWLFALNRLFEGWPGWVTSLFLCPTLLNWLSRSRKLAWCWIVFDELLFSDVWSLSNYGLFPHEGILSHWFLPEELLSKTCH